MRVYDNGNGRVYGCLKRQRKRRFLAEVNEIDDSIQSVRTRGNYVAWHLIRGPACRANCPPDVTATSTISIKNLRSARGRSTPADPAAPLKLSSAGVAAWVESAPPDAAVRALTRSGAVTLDTGDISASSLRVRRKTVSWVRDGERRSATP